MFGGQDPLWSVAENRVDAIRREVGAIVQGHQWPEECAEYRRELSQYVMTIVGHYTRMKRLRFIAKNDKTGGVLQIHLGRG